MQLYMSVLVIRELHAVASFFLRDVAESQDSGRPGHG
jgi:hypothetical protein